MIEAQFNYFIVLAVVVPVAGAVISLLVKPRWGAIVFASASLFQLVSVSFAGATVRRGVAPVLDHTWLWQLGSGLRFTMDPLSVTFAALVALVSFAASVYAIGFVDAEKMGRPFFAWLCLFSGAMMGVIVAGDVLLFYLFWELMLLPSTALILGWGSGRSARKTALKYFVITHLGAVLMLAGILRLNVLTGTSNMASIRQALFSFEPSVVLKIVWLISLGFAVKLAVVPAHVWLPDTYAESSVPVAVLLSAAMMSAGIYGFLRFIDVMMPAAITGALATPLMVAGVVNQWYGGIQALRQSELKRVVAYSSISQVGYILFGLGTATAVGTQGAIMQAVSHGLGKALLFMSVGAVVKQAGATKFSEAGGLGRRMPVTMMCCVVAGLTLAGAPPFAAFQSEWLMFAGGMSRAAVALTLLSIAASVVTVLYCLSLVLRVFYGPERSPQPVESEAPAAMLVPMVSIAALSLLIGVMPAFTSGWARAAVQLVK